MEFYNNASSPSLKQRFKSTFCTCFCHPDDHHNFGQQDNAIKKTLQRTSSINGSEHAKLDLVHHGCSHPDHQSHSVDAVKGKCKNFISRLGGSGGGGGTRPHHQGHRRRHSSSADFRYDPLSYSLNFDEGLEDERLDEFPLRSFASRLPATPPREHKAVALS